MERTRNRLQHACDLGEQDNRPLIQEAVDQLAAYGGGSIELPPARRFYRCSGTIQWRTGVSLVGSSNRSCHIQQDVDSVSPLFDISGVKGATFENIRLVGNGQSNNNRNSNAIAIYNGASCSDIVVRNCAITDWTRSCISLDGVDGLTIVGNCLERATYGGGVIISRGLPSGNVRISKNTIRDTQFGNIHAWGPVKGAIVSENFLDRSGWKGGSYRERNVADNVTLYDTEENEDIIVRSNICRNSGENAIHIGGRRLIVQSNVVVNPALYGVIVSNKPYDSPRACDHVQVSDNTITLADRTSPDSRGIGLRNCRSFIVRNNLISDARCAIELLSIGDDLNIEGGLVSGNLLQGCGDVAFSLRGTIRDTHIFSNGYDAPALHRSAEEHSRHFGDNQRLSGRPAD